MEDYATASEKAVLDHMRQRLGQIADEQIAQRNLWGHNILARTRSS
jgi:hypothetical protein